MHTAASSAPRPLTMHSQHPLVSGSDVDAGCQAQNTSVVQHNNSECITRPSYVAHACITVVHQRRGEPVCHEHLGS